MPPPSLPLIAAVALPCLWVVLITRPLAEEWPATVAKLRKKEKGAAGSLRAALEPARTLKGQALTEHVRDRIRVGTRVWEEDKLWAADLLFLTAGCTKKKCYLGFLGVWHKTPNKEFDRYVLLGAHGVGCAVSYAYDLGTFFRYFSPRFEQPYTLLLGCFATSSPFELLWLSGSILGIGAGLQNAVGRAAFLFLYLGGAGVASLLAAYWRHSPTGAGGALAAVTFHTLMAPSARHNIMGLTMGAPWALAVQVGLASWPAFNGAAPQPVTFLALNLVPVLLGGSLYLSGLLQ